MQNFNLNYILKMGTPPMKFWGTYSQCTKSKEDKPPHSFIMAEEGRGLLQGKFLKLFLLIKTVIMKIMIVDQILKVLLMMKIIQQVKKVI